MILVPLLKIPALALILSIETTTKICSVAILKDEVLINLQESGNEDYSHAEKLNVFIEKALNETGIKPTELDAVAVAGGPGSYTGLRIGVSSAKGLCYAIGKPLIAVDPLLALALQFHSDHQPGQDVLIFPMIDARRDEVFMSVFSVELNQLEETSAQIIDANFFDKYPGKTCVLIGDGAPKFATLFKGDDRIQVRTDCFASSHFIGLLAEGKFKRGEVENLAYYEPFYGKEFKTTVSTKIRKTQIGNS